MKIGYQTDLEEQRILGLIDDDMYYMLKIRDAGFNYDVEEQKRLMRLRYLERRQKQKREAEEKQKQEKAEKEQEKAIKQAIEKDLPAKIEKTLEKELQKIFSKR